MGEPAPNAGYRGGTRPQRGLSRGNPPPTRAIVGEPTPNAGYREAIVGEPAPNAGYREAIVGLSRGYCGGTRPQRGLLWGYREVYNILRLT